MWKPMLAGVLLALAIAVLMAPAAGGWRWRAAGRTLSARLEQGARSPGTVFGAAALDTLPAPVARFLRETAPPGRPAIRAARLRQSGRFRAGRGGNAWRPFAATQSFRASPPAFVWSAGIRMMPGLSVHVLDSYLDGAGRMHGALLGLFTVVDARGPGIDAGALHRYLAEAMWIPTRLRPGDGLTWEAVDDSTARATLADGGNRVSLNFRFSADGVIESVWTAARLREVEGAFMPTPWDARVLAYGERGGMRIPTRVEVAWTIDGVREPYWLGEVTEAEFSLAGSAAPPD